MPHPLHEIVADVIDTGLPPHIRLIRDPACLGEQRIPLFLANEKSRANWLCDVDALVVNDGQIRAIIEIDESDVKPTQVAGKFFTSAMASYYIHDTAGAPVPKATSVTFLQFLSTVNLPTDTSKRDQWQKIETKIRSLLPLGNITNYYVFFGTPDEFRPQEVLYKVDHAIAEALIDIPRNITWLEPWEALQRSDESMVRELKQELPAGHILDGVPVIAVARRIDCDDILFATADALMPLAVVHLTWTATRESATNWPSTEIYRSWQDWIDRGLTPDHRAYQAGNR